jgi:penicillin-binding protein 2
LIGQRETLNKRIVFLICICGLSLSVILGQLVRWQLIHSSGLISKAVKQRSIEAPLAPARGDIYDRNGIPLTNRNKLLGLVVYPKLFKNPETTFTSLQEALNNALPFTSCEQFIKQTYYVTEIQINQISSLAKIDDDGIAVINYPRRYSEDGFASHLIGYINSADNKGEAGLELLFDRILKGYRPRYCLEAKVDGRGNFIRGSKYSLTESEEKYGKIHLTIDSRIQEIVEKVANKSLSKGAIIVTDPSNGEILSFVSRPMFIGDRLKEYLNKANSPFTNRVFSSYAPGSVFKIIVAAAALEENLVQADEVFFCPGYYQLGQQRFKCHSHDNGGHGTITFFDGLVQSCNPVFIEVGQRVGMNKLREYSERFGLGTVTELNFPGEKGGNVPKAKYYSPGDLANFSIGQGGLTASPVQILTMLNVIINNGKYVPVNLVKNIQRPEEDYVQPVIAPPGRQIISQTTAQTIQKMLEGVTVYGTARQANLPYLRSAGKTGTAETGLKSVDETGINHAWFTGYFPADSPKYSIVVFVEAGMSGSGVATPIFREIMEEIAVNLN